MEDGEFGKERKKKAFFRQDLQDLQDTGSMP
jgi:hypothetical protein